MGDMPPYVWHSETSRAAAADFADKAPSVRELVYRQFLFHSDTGLTDEELATLVEVSRPKTLYSTSRARRVELVRDGLVVDTGERRRGRSGKRMVVWALKREPHTEGWQ